MSPWVASLLFSKFFIYWPCWIFTVAHGLSLGAVSSGYSLLGHTDGSLQWLPVLWLADSGRVGFSSRGTQASLPHVTWSLPGTCVLCTGIWILNHWTTRKVPPATRPPTWLAIHRQRDAGDGAGSERGRCGQFLDKLSSTDLTVTTQILDIGHRGIWELSWGGQTKCYKQITTILQLR